MSNLLEKASIVTTPTAYDNGKILSVKPAPSLGSELVVNGDFATDSNWFKDANWTIANGKATSTGVGRMFQSIPFLETNIGTTVQVSFDIIDITANGVVVNCYGGVSQLFTTVGTHTFTTTTINNTNLYFNNGGAGNLIGSIDNVSVKQEIDGNFDFTRNSSATRVNSQGLIEDVQILSSNLVSNGDFSQEGSELITNGDFATDSNWNKGANWSIEDNKLVGSNADTSTYQGVGIQVNKSYKIQFTVIDYVSGSVRPLLNGLPNVDGTNVSSNGTYTQYLQSNSGSNGNFTIKGVFFNGSIDNVSVKEVGQDWNLGTGWSIGANKAIGDGTMGGNDVVRQLINFSQGTTYRFSFTVLDYVSGGVFVRNPFNGYLDIASANGSYSFDYVAGINDYIDFRGNSFVGSISNISVIEITDDTNLPRIDYTGGVGHWLFEPQSTNKITQSENLSNMQIAFGGAITLDSNFINPSGQNGSYFIYDTDGGTQSRFRVSNSGFTLGDKLSYSVFLKSNSSSLITIGGNYGGENCTFNVGSKTLISQGAAVNSYEIINFTNGWTRYIVNTTFTNTVAGNAYPFFTTNATLSEKIYLWGHQLEVQSFATSYIPTSGAISTRLQDAAFGAGSSDLINSTQGVLYAEIAALADGVGTRTISVSDGTNNNSITIRYTTNAGRVNAFIVAGGIIQFSANISGVSVLDFNKVAIKYSLNDMALWINGIEVATDISGTMPLGLNEINFTRGDGANNFFGKTKCLAVFKEALTDAELTCLTTI